MDTMAVGVSDIGSVVQEGLSKKTTLGMRPQMRGKELGKELCKQREQHVLRGLRWGCSRCV